jgi:hypothetical protein
MKVYLILKVYLIFKETGCFQSTTVITLFFQTFHLDKSDRIDVLTWQQLWLFVNSIATKKTESDSKSVNVSTSKVKINKTQTKSNTEIKPPQIVKTLC